MPFKIKDLLFSSILYMANKYLLKIIGILEEAEGVGSTGEVQNLKSNSSDEISKYNKYKMESATLDSKN